MEIKHGKFLYFVANTLIIFPSLFSTQSTLDQLSAKDSGKGDSECNDSDSDVSREGQKKSSTETMEKEIGKLRITPGLLQSKSLVSRIILFLCIGF